MNFYIKKHLSSLFPCASKSRMYDLELAFRHGQNYMLVKILEAVDRHNTKLKRMREKK